MYLHVLHCPYTAVITLLTLPLHLNPPLNLTIPPNLSLYPTSKAVFYNATWTQIGYKYYLGYFCMHVAYIAVKYT